jgi:hypothetical protein
MDLGHVKDIILPASVRVIIARAVQMNINEVRFIPDCVGHGTL